MARWNIICYSFKRVREMIEDCIDVNDCMQIMYELEGCCDELTPDNEIDWDFYDAFRDLKSEIHDEIEMMEDDDYESCGRTVDYYLNEFYDLCDNARVWLEI